MTVLDIKVQMTLRGGGDYNVIFYPANLGTFPKDVTIESTLYYLQVGQFTIGALNAPSVFPNLDDAEAYLYASYCAQILSDINSLMGSAWFSSTRLVRFCDGLDDALASKQPISANLTSLAGQSSSSYGRPLLNLANQAALQAAVGVSTAGLSGSYADITGKPSLATVATSGDYTDLSNKPSIPSVARTTSTLSLSLVGTGATGTQISSTKDSTVRATVSTSTTSTIGGPATSVVALKICSTNDSSEGNWTTVATFESDQTVTLAIALQCVQVVKGQISADVPAGYYVKLVNSGSGTHSEAFVSGQKTIYG